MTQGLKKAVIDTALKLKEYHLISLSGGNVSLRLEDGNILVTPSGMDYEAMVESDVLLMDPQGNILGGGRRPSVDTVALLYIYEHLPKVNSIIHTHQVYATAVGLIEDVLPAAVTTLANVTLGEVNVTQYSSAASVDMGIQTVEYLNDKRAVILKNHGVITVGEDLKQALYAAVYLEDAAKTYLVAKMAGKPSILNSMQVHEAVEAFKGCGQK
ncbi:class II aldolase/adducin family protein [Christensenella timonensis]|uniref:class II aldolase/adducin family protein n=1 Tax=Christensenella timonensis TaxID=1816678 RepID=UPI00082E3C00|nr:class II aldolase/adducin family protein [Christensenella timonensis]